MKKPSAAKTAALALTGLLVLLVLLLAGLLITASSDWARQRALTLAREELAGQGLGLEVASASGSLLHHLRLEGVRLSQGGRTLLTLQSLELDHNPLALLGGRLKLSRLTLKGPRVFLPWNLPAGGGGSFPLALTLERVVVQAGFLDPGGSWGPVGNLSGLELEGRLNLDLRGLAAALTIKDGRLALAGSGRTLRLGGQAVLQKDVLDLERLVLGRGQSRLELNGRLELNQGLAYQGRVKAMLARAGDLPLAWPGPRPPRIGLDLQARVSGDQGGCSLQGRLRGGPGRAGFKGRVDFGRPGGRVEFTLAGVNLASWGLSPLALSLGGEARLRFQGWPGDSGFRAELQAGLKRLQVAGVESDRLEVEARYDRQGLRVQKLAAAGAWGSLRGRGHLGPGGESLEARVEFREISPPPALAGRLPGLLRRAVLSGELRAGGSLARPRLELELAPSRLGPGLELDGLRLVGERASGGWRVEKMALQAPWGELQARGRLDRAGLEMDFELGVEDLGPLASQLAAAGLPAARGDYAGSLQARGSLGGGWDSPGLRLQARARGVRGPGLALARLEVELKAPALLPRPQGRLELGLWDLEWAGHELSRLELEAAWDQPDGLELSLRARAPQGGLELALGCRDPWADIRVVDIPSLVLTLQGRPPIRLARPGRVKLWAEGFSLGGLELVSGQSSLSLQGDWKTRGDLRGRVRLRDLELARWLPRAGLPPSARLDLGLDVGGSSRQPRLKLKGGIRDLNWPQLPPMRLSLAGGYDPGNLWIKGKVTSGAEGLFNLDSRMDIDFSLAPPAFTTGPGALQITAGSRHFPLKILNPLLPGVSGLRGRLDFQFQARGSLARPRLGGYLELKQGGLALDATAQSFADLELRLDLQDRRLRISRARVGRQGRLKLEGWLDLPWGGEGRVHLDLKARDFPLSLGMSGNCRLAAELRARGDLESPLLTGWVRPEKVILELGSSAPPEMKDVVVLRPGQKPPPVGQRAQPPVFRPGGPLGRAGIEVEIPCDNLKVQMGRGWLLLEGKLRLSKKPREALRYLGKISVSNGVVIVQGKRFQVTRASADFAGRDKPDPDLDAKAFLRVGDVVAWITVTGTPSHPRFQFTSEPPMSQADVISTIVFGKPADSLSTQQSQSLTAQALALLGQEGAEHIRRILGPAFSPDVITVHNSPSGGSSLEAGKYLSPDLYLRYRQNLEEDGGQNLGLEYRVNRYFSVESQVGTTRDTGIDVITDFDFD